MGFIPPSQQNRWILNPGVSPPGEAGKTPCLFAQTAAGTEASASANRRFSVSHRLVLVLIPHLYLYGSEGRALRADLEQTTETKC